MPALRFKGIFMKVPVTRLKLYPVVAIACSVLLAVLPVAALAKKSNNHLDDTATEANAFLDRFTGDWIGTGDFDGSPIADALAIERILGDLYVQIRQDDLLGDFEAHMYFGFDAQDEQYELYVFGSFTGFGGNLPVRVMTGHRMGENLLIVQEANELRKSWGAPPTELLRYTFEFLDDNTFVLSKTWVTGKKGKDKPFVVEVFEKEP